MGWSSGVGDRVGQGSCVDDDSFLLLAERDSLQDPSAQPIDGVGDIDQDRATMTTNWRSGTAKPSGGGGEWLCG